MKITIPANDYNALLATAADNDVRHYLNGIFIDKENRCMVATDGCSLLRMDLPSGVITDGADSFILERTPKAPVDGDVTIDDIAGTIAFRTKTGKHKATHAVVKIDGRFPDYQRVIPSGERVDNSAPLHFQSHLISRTVDALRAKWPVVRITRAVDQHDSGAPFFAEIMDRDDLTLVVMPCRW